MPIWRLRLRRDLVGKRGSAPFQMRKATELPSERNRANMQMALGAKSERFDGGDRQAAQHGPDRAFSNLSLSRSSTTIDRSRGDALETTANEYQRRNKDLQDLIDLVPQVLVELEADGRWIHVNRTACEYTGLTLEEYKSIDVGKRVIHPEDIDRMRSVRTRGFAGITPFEFEGRMLGKDSKYRWFLFRYRPSIEEGQVKKWYGSATEIEALKQEEERVKREVVRLEERTRIAQELHDTLLQSFALASLHIGMAVANLPSGSCVRQQLHEVLQLVETGMKEGRNAILDLRSPQPTRFDMSLSLLSMQHEFLIRPGIDFRVIVVGEERPLQERIGREIYRIGKEALANAFRHSGASWIGLELEYADTGLRMRIRDNGCGIDPEVLRVGREGHCGLTGMRERAAKVRGFLEILSQSTGTEVSLRIPGEIVFSPDGISSTSACNVTCQS